MSVSVRRDLKARCQDASFAALSRRLSERAERRAVETAKARLLAERNPDTAWRRADVLWPLFTKG